MKVPYLLYFIYEKCETRWLKTVQQTGQLLEVLRVQRLGVDCMRAETRWEDAERLETILRGR